MSARQKIPRNAFILAFVALASGLGQDLVAPALPGFLLALGAARAEIGLIDGLLNGATAAFRLISGLLSDRLRQRKLLVLAGYALSSIARPLLAFAKTFPAVAALRLADGIGKGTKDAPRDALVAEAAAEIRGRAFGFHRLVDTAGSVIGPLIASIILLYFAAGPEGYRLVFALSAIPGAIALALIIFGVREKKRAENPAKTGSRAFPAAFWIFLAATTIAMLTRANDALVLVRAADSGVPAAWLPALFGGFTLLYALMSYPIGVWSDRLGRLPFLISGWLTLAVAEAGFALFQTTASVVAIFIFYGMFYALTEGTGRAFIADLVPENSRGTAYAVFHAATGAALILGGFGIGRVWDAVSLQAAFTTTAIGSAVAALILSSLFTIPLRTNPEPGRGRISAGDPTSRRLGL
ncbi:MFS transporter [Patescibacteria group bacterium]|nr:MAG: MFS transporter [Patescibacteria group bacterium]